MDPAVTAFDIAPLRNDRGIQLRRHGDEVRLAMDGALREEPPPSVSEVARRLHFARGEHLYQIDHARSEMLAARYREAVRALQPRPSRAPRKCEQPQMKRILEDSLAREYPVSITEIAVQNGYANAGCIRLEFPDLCRAIGQKIAQRRKAEMDGKGEILKAALERRSAAHRATDGRKAGFRVSWSSAAKLSCAIPGASSKGTVYKEAQKMQLVFS